MAKKKSITQNTLVNLYMDYVLEHNHAPKSIYSFSKSNGFEEAEFYKFFGNFETLEKAIFTQFFTNTIETLESSKTLIHPQLETYCPECDILFRLERNY